MSRTKFITGKELEIKSFDKKGLGAGEYLFENGSGEKRLVEVQVPWAIPGDTVRVTLKKRRRRVWQSELEEVIQPSPQRVQARCIHFAACGGCRWQQLSYRDQLEQKEQWISTFFAPFTDLPSFTRFPIIPCESPWEYRNKMEFSFSQNLAGERFLGLMRSRGRVENLTECHLVSSWFMDAIAVTREWWEETGLLAYFPPADRGSLRTLTVREGIRTGDRMVILQVSGNPDYALKKSDIKSFTEKLKSALTPEKVQGELSLFLRIQQIQKGQPTQFYEMHLAGPPVLRERLQLEGRESLEFHVSPSAFFQPNTKQAEKLYSRALELAEISSDSVVFDLYCGTGTLGILASSLAKDVLGIEIVPEATLDAEANIATNSIKNMRVLTGDVGEVLGQLRQDPAFVTPDLVMVDPPRAGLDEKALKHLLELKPKKILYISCNPRTQAENCEPLTKGGYRLMALQGVDQFPHTIHMESIALLELYSHDIYQA